MSCQSSYTNAEEIASFFCRGEGYDADSEPSLEAIERYITKGAARINASLRMTAQCDCTFTGDAAVFLEELNIVAAALLIYCPDCSRRLTDDQKDFYNGWLGEQLALLRTGEIDLCAGATGIHYPAVGWAEQSVTEFAAARLVLDAQARTG